MKIVTNKFFWVSVLVLLMVSLPLSTYANPQKMKYKDYLVELERWKAREQAARTSIADEQAKIDALKKQIDDVNGKIDNTWNEIFSLLGITRQDYEKFQQDLTNLESKVHSLQALTPEQLYQRKSEIDDADKTLQGLFKSPCALIPRMERRLNALQRDIEALKARVPAPKSDIYTVVRGDCLWRIAAKPKIYNDPYKWLRIWSANLDKISNPNLIYPGQNFTILREIDSRTQYIVVRGDFLKKIAGYPQIYGDPFQWKKIYEANKRMIKDPHVIYPEMILAIPR
jgi:nucleoid-associated protein YgaU